MLGKLFLLSTRTTSCKKHGLRISTLPLVSFSDGWSEVAGACSDAVGNTAHCGGDSRLLQARGALEKGMTISFPSAYIPSPGLQASSASDPLTPQTLLGSEVSLGFASAAAFDGLRFVRGSIRETDRT